VMAFSIRSLRAWFRVAVVAGSADFLVESWQDCFLRAKIEPIYRGRGVASESTSSALTVKRGL
jgi:hypothetical protein